MVVKGIELAEFRKHKNNNRALIRIQMIRMSSVGLVYLLCALSASELGSCYDRCP